MFCKLFGLKFFLRVVRCASTLTTHLGEHHIVNININNLSSWSGSPIFGEQGTRRESVSRSAKRIFLHCLASLPRLALPPYPPILAPLQIRRQKNVKCDWRYLSILTLFRSVRTPCKASDFCPVPSVHPR